MDILASKGNSLFLTLESASLLFTFFVDNKFSTINLRVRISFAFCLETKMKEFQTLFSNLSFHELRNETGE